MKMTDHAFEYGTLQQKTFAMKHSPVITPDHIGNIPDGSLDMVRHLADTTKHNKNLSDATLTAIKNKVVSLQPGEFSRLNSIDDRIGDKFTHDDVKTIVDNHINNKTGFSQLHYSLPEKLSDRVMDHIEDRMAQHHDQIEDMHEEGKEDTPEWEHHGKVLQKLMMTHGELMQSHFNNHIDEHVKRDDASTWHNFDEGKHDKLHDRYIIAHDISNESNHPMISGIVHDGETSHRDVRDEVEAHREDIKSELVNR
jgi:hypothetical protein